MIIQGLSFCLGFIIRYVVSYHHLFETWNKLNGGFKEPRINIYWPQQTNNNKQGHKNNIYNNNINNKIISFIRSLRLTFINHNYI